VPQVVVFPQCLVEMPHTQRKGLARELVEVKKRRVVEANGSIYILANFNVQTAINHLKNNKHRDHRFNVNTKRP